MRDTAPSESLSPALHPLLVFQHEAARSAQTTCGCRNQACNLSERCSGPRSRPSPLRLWCYHMLARTRTHAVAVQVHTQICTCSTHKHTWRVLQHLANHAAACFDCEHARTHQSLCCPRQTASSSRLQRPTKQAALFRACLHASVHPPISVLSPADSSSRSWPSAHAASTVMYSSSSNGLPMSRLLRTVVFWIQGSCKRSVVGHVTHDKAAACCVLDHLTRITCRMQCLGSPMTRLPRAVSWITHDKAAACSVLDHLTRITCRVQCLGSPMTRLPRAVSWITHDKAAACSVLDPRAQQKQAGSECGSNVSTTQ